MLRIDVDEDDLTVEVNGTTVCRLDMIASTPEHIAEYVSSVVRPLVAQTAYAARKPLNKD